MQASQEILMLIVILILAQFPKKKSSINTSFCLFCTLTINVSKKGPISYHPLQKLSNPPFSWDCQSISVEDSGFPASISKEE